MVLHRCHHWRVLWQPIADQWCGSMTVSSEDVSNGGGSSPIAGYTIVQAINMNRAVALTKWCPVLNNGGTIEIAQLVVTHTETFKGLMAASMKRQTGCLLMLNMMNEALKQLADK